MDQAGTEFSIIATSALSPEQWGSDQLTILGQTVYICLIFGKLSSFVCYTARKLTVQNKWTSIDNSVGQNSQLFLASTCKDNIIGREFGQLLTVNWAK